MSECVRECVGSPRTLGYPLAQTSPHFSLATGWCCATTRQTARRSGTTWIQSSGGGQPQAAHPLRSLLLNSHDPHSCATLARSTTCADVGESVLLRGARSATSFRLGSAACMIPKGGRSQTHSSAREQTTSCSGGQPPSFPCAGPMLRLGSFSLNGHNR